MTTAHETPTNLGFPSPFSAGNAAPLNGLEYPLERDNSVSHLSPCAMNAGAPVNPQNGCFAAGEYHVPSHPYAPRTAPYQHDDLSSFPIDPNPLPERCQFMFSDGRQCTMPRSDVHPSLCRFHAEREEQLFGSPVPGGNVVGASLDLPELYSACQDLSSAAGVKRALAQVFRLFAQRRISRQEAATFGYLGQMLLQTMSAARVQERDLPVPAVTTLGVASHTREAEPAPAASARSGEAPVSAGQSELAESDNLAAPTPLATVEHPPERNSRQFNTYDFAELKLPQNQHLQKSNGGGDFQNSKPYTQTEAPA